MGRLFWKFFFFILLAQITAGVGIGSALWLEARSHVRTHLAVDESPPAAFHVEAAAATLRYGGADALRELLGQQRRNTIYAIDENAVELLGRRVAPATLAQARMLLAAPEQPHPPDAPERPSAVRSVVAPDGHLYMMFQAPPPDGYRATAPGHALPFMEGRQPPRFEQPPPELIFPLLPLAMTTLASLFFALLLAWYFAQPIRQLKQAFNAAADGNLDYRLGPLMGRRRDELSDLGSDFDRMTTKLHALMESQRRLLHDVSHELRSPLARLQASIGLAVQQPDKMQESLQRIAREGGRIDKLVSELLTLSKLETGVMHSRVEAIDMQELLNGIIEDAQFEASAKDCSVVLSDRVHVMVDGDPELLQRAIENVVRNAVRYSGNGAEPGATNGSAEDNGSDDTAGTAVAAVAADAVAVTTAADTGVVLAPHFDPLTRTLTISVQDRGPGVPEAELQLIFDPFYRGSNTRADGHGLGLAIAIRIIAAHHGTIRARNRPQGGLQVDIVLPVSATQSS